MEEQSNLIYFMLYMRQQIVYVSANDHVREVT